LSKKGRQTLLVTGSCQSGKSRYAQQWAEGLGSYRLFLATAKVTDDEMAERIARHRAQRREGWITIEEPLEVHRVFEQRGAEVEVILLDCITVWLSNLLLEDLSNGDITSRVNEMVGVIRQVPCSVALVTNEVGWGVVPPYPLGRRFRDLVGAVNQRLAEMANTVVLMVAGVPLRIKGE
jgi:adenosylcobinamide kinase/adenosylcobinamide-phosphate guanylyltransferase